MKYSKQKFVIIIIGPPGAGKGTQAELLAEKLNLYYFETARILEESWTNATKNDYVKVNEEKFYLNSNTYEVLPNLNITYTTAAGDSVLLEFSCQLGIELYGFTTNVFIKFEIDGQPPTPDTEIEATVMDPLIYANIPFVMRHHVESSSEGSHIVKVLVRIDDIVTTSFVEFCVLTATTY